MRRTRVVIASAILLAALPAGPVLAAAPVTAVEERYDADVVAVDEGLSELCGFRVTASAKGHFTRKDYFDRNGAFIRSVSHPSFRQTLTGPGGSITTDDRGVDKVSFTEDGTFTIFGTGIHLRVKGEVQAIGLWILAFDGTTGELDATYHGNFDLEAPELGAWVCGRLGPSS